MAQGSRKKTTLYGLYRSSGDSAPKMSHRAKLECSANITQEMFCVVNDLNCTYRCFSDFSGPFVPWGFFPSAANGLSRFDDSNVSCCANFERFTQSSELLDTIIENNIGEVTHVIVMSYPALGMCLKGLWVYLLFFSSLGGSHTLSKEFRKCFKCGVKNQITRECKLKLNLGSVICFKYIKWVCIYRYRYIIS